MTWPILNGGSGRKRNQIIGVDLGNRTTKAVLMERQGEALALSRFALLETPAPDPKLSPEPLAKHLRATAQSLQAKAKWVCLAVGRDDTVVRQVELPPIPVDEMRLVLKNNPKSYLQQDLSRYAFDCHVFPPKPAKSGETPKPGTLPKLKVLVAGAREQLLQYFQTAIKRAGLSADRVVPGLIGPVNAFERALPQVFANEVVALVDIGFKQSSICVLDHGELALSRVVNLGGDHLTVGLAEAMNITYAEAEGIKVGLASEAKSAIENLVVPLGRELRASLDFFEHQQDRLVTHVYVSGGSARSELILQTLHAELGVECRVWNPAESLHLALPPEQAAEMAQVGPQLAVAVGAALAAF
ncbi:MAG: pilus assembly protein PilM [Verrucomicrobiota bacterium]|nr:pilus assembly protein PilM [Verrucomicrobiota bacterium]